jgi:small GTP-binding protein
MASVSIACIGDTDSGKTCLLDTFENDEFPAMVYMMDKTRTDAEKAFQYEGKDITVKIQDFGGEDENEANMKAGMSKVEVFMVCFDLSEPTKLSNVTEKWAKVCGDIPKILVGCKSDARDQ